VTIVAGREAFTAPLLERVAPGNYVMAEHDASATLLARLAAAAMTETITG
jgi:hypothetical protein